MSFYQEARDQQIMIMLKSCDDRICRLDEKLANLVIRVEHIVSKIEYDRRQTCVTNSKQPETVKSKSEVDEHRKALYIYAYATFMLLFVSGLSYVMERGYSIRL